MGYRRGRGPQTEKKPAAKYLYDIYGLVSLYIFGPWLTGEPLSDWLGVVGGGGVSATDTVPTQYEGFRGN